MSLRKIPLSFALLSVVFSCSGALANEKVDLQQKGNLGCILISSDIESESLLSEPIHNESAQFIDPKTNTSKYEEQSNTILSTICGTCQVNGFDGRLIWGTCIPC